VRGKGKTTFTNALLPPVQSEGGGGGSSSLIVERNRRGETFLALYFRGGEGKERQSVLLFSHLPRSKRKVEKRGNVVASSRCTAVEGRKGEGTRRPFYRRDRGVEGGSLGGEDKLRTLPLVHSSTRGKTGKGDYSHLYSSHKRKEDRRRRDMSYHHATGGVVLTFPITFRGRRTSKRKRARNIVHQKAGKTQQLYWLLPQGKGEGTSASFSSLKGRGFCPIFPPEEGIEKGKEEKSELSSSLFFEKKGEGEAKSFLLYSEKGTGPAKGESAALELSKIRSLKEKKGKSGNTRTLPSLWQ